MIPQFLARLAQIIEAALKEFEESAGIPPQEFDEIEIECHPLYQFYSILAGDHFVLLDVDLTTFGYCNLATIDENFATPRFDEEEVA